MPRGVKGSAMTIEERRAKKAAYMAAWRAAHPTYHRDRYRAWAALHYKKIPRYNKYQRAFSLRLKFGLSEEAYDAMVSAQGGLCAICGKLETSKFRGVTRRLAVDHNHVTGALRKLLCSRCNLNLGILEDVEFREKALAYLREHDST